jgi:hypothetical protein
MFCGVSVSGNPKLTTCCCLAHTIRHARTRDDLETLPRVFLALSSCITSITADPDRVRCVASHVALRCNAMTK